MGTPDNPQPVQLPQVSTDVTDVSCLAGTLAQGEVQKGPGTLYSLLEAWAGRNELLGLGSPRRLQGNAWNITKLFEKSHSTAACSQAQIILNPLVSANQEPYLSPPRED